MILAAGVPWQAIGVVIGVLFGTGGVGVLLYYRSTNAKLMGEAVKAKAEGIKAETEGRVMLNEAVQAGYDKLLESQTRRLDDAIKRLEVCEASRSVLQTDIELVRRELSAGKQRTSDMEAELTATKVKVAAARAELVNLQDRVDRMGDEKPRPTASTSEMVRKSVGARKKRA